MAVNFLAFSDRFDLKGPVLDYDFAEGQELTAEEASAIMLSVIADSMRRIEHAITIVVQTRA